MQQIKFTSIERREMAVTAFLAAAWILVALNAQGTVTFSALLIFLACGFVWGGAIKNCFRLIFLGTPQLALKLKQTKKNRQPS